MIATRFVLAAFSAAALLAATAPAHAEGDRFGRSGDGYRREEHRDREWREREWRERHWRPEYRPYAYGYVAPPAIIFAPRW